MADYRHIKSKAVRSIDGNSKEGRALSKDPEWQKCPEAKIDDLPDSAAIPQPTPEPDGRDPLAEHPGSD